MSKRQIPALLLVMLLCLSLSVSAYATQSAGTLAKVTDKAGILSASEVEALNTTAERLSQEYSCGIYIVVLEDYRSFTDGDIARCGEELYEYFSLGEGLSRNCLLLVMSMAERDFDMTAHGDFANYAFTDYGKQVLQNAFASDFRRDNWYDGFSRYLSAVEQELQAARNGSPVDVEAYEDPGLPFGVKIAIAVGVGSLVALVVLAGFKAQMKTARPKTDAEDYVVQGSARLQVKTDQFINRTETVQIIERNQSGGSGGHHGGTSVNAGGFSHHSGKF